MKIKTLLAAALVTVALSGCGGNYFDEAEIIPGAEAEMLAVCELNGGFVRGWVTPRNLHFNGTASVQQYRTIYHVECKNGVQLDRMFLGKKQPD